MSKAQLGKKIYEVSYLTGEFTLRSGQISNEYFDKYRFEADPQILHAIVVELAKLIPQDIDILAGLEMGGIPLVSALALVTGHKMIFVRKQAKTYGTCRLAEGCADLTGKRICVIEDVVTTGGQIIESVRKLRNLGGIVDNVACAIQRTSNSKDILSKEGLNLISLFTMEEIRGFL